MEEDLTQTGGKFKISESTKKAIEESKATAGSNDKQGGPPGPGGPPPPPPSGPGGPPPPPPSGPGGPPPPPPPGPSGPKKTRYRLAGQKKESAPEESKSEESMTYQEKLVRFYKARRENPDKYTYAPDGNLVVMDDSGKPTTTIPMRNFRPLNEEEVRDLSNKRMEEVRSYEVSTGEEEKKSEDLSYTDAIKNLRDVYARYRRGETGYTPRSVMDANKKVQEAEKRRTNALYPIRFTKTVVNPQINHILLDSKDKRHIRHNIFILDHYPFKSKDAFGHYVTPEEEAELARKATMKGGSSIDVILIDSYEDPTRGFLHPAYTKDFSYTSTQYSSLYQAFEVERLKMLKNMFLVEQLMKTRSPRTIHSLASQDKTAIPNSYDLWLSILKAFYSQNTDLGKKLVETGSSIFSLRDSIISSPSDYLNALIAIRSMLAENEEGGATAPIEKRVITEEEQKKARMGAIINARRFGAT